MSHYILDYKNHFIEKVISKGKVYIENKRIYPVSFKDNDTFYDMKIKNSKEKYKIDRITFNMIISKVDIYLFKCSYKDQEFYTALLNNKERPIYTFLGKGGQGAVIGNGNITEKKYKYRTSLIKEISIYKYLFYSELYNFHIPKLLGYDIDNNCLYLEQIKMINTFTEKNVDDVIKIMYQLWQIGIINSDIKPDNILRADDKTYLIDWGNSCIDRSGDQCQYRGVCGTRKYMSPEYLITKLDSYHLKEKTKKYYEKGFKLIKKYDGNKIDIWSLGMTILLLYHKQLQKKKLEKVDDKVIDCYFKKQKIYDLLLEKKEFKKLEEKYPYIKKMLEMNIKKRANIQELYGEKNHLYTYGIKVYPLIVLRKAYEHYNIDRKKALTTIYKICKEQEDRRYDILFNSIELLDFYIYKKYSSNSHIESIDYDNFVILSRILYRNSEVSNDDINNDMIKIIYYLDCELICSGFFTYVSFHLKGKCTDKFITKVFLKYLDIDTKRIEDFKTNFKGILEI